MKKLFLISVLIFLAIFSCTNGARKARIEIRLENIEDGYLLITLAPHHIDPAFVFDTLHLVNGRTFLDTLINELHKGYILAPSMYKELSNGEPHLLRSKVIEFFVDSGQKIVINGVVKEFHTDYTISGSKLNELFSEFRSRKSRFATALSKAMYLLEDYNAGNTQISEEVNEAHEWMFDYFQQMKQLEIDYVKENLDSELSAYLLFNMGIESQKEFFPLLGASVKNTPFGKTISDNVAFWNPIQVGGLAPDFSLQSLAGETVSLGGLLGQPVLLSFWGTWCAPCVEEIPKMKEFVSKNKDRVKVIGIACRENEKLLVQFVEDNIITWTQIRNPETAEDNLILKYGIQGFPTKVLINGEGIISGIFRFARDENFSKIEALLNDNE